MKTAIKRVLNGLGYEIWKTESFPFHVDYCRDIERLARANSPASLQTLFDIGANKGQTALHLTEYFPAARVHAFEPVQGTFDILTERTLGKPNILRYRLAFGSQAGPCQIFLQDSTQWNSLTEAINVPPDGCTPAGEAPNGRASSQGMAKIETADAKVEMIEVETLDGFCERNAIEHIDLLKTDTEGYDLELLRGAVGLLERKAISFIYSEVGFSPEDKRHTFLIELKEFLAAHDFVFYGLYELVNYGTPAEYCNALFVARDFLEK